MKELHIIVCGDRFWRERGSILQVMRILRDNLGTYVVIEGEAPGVDAMARSIAELDLNLPFKPFPADWTLYGKAAGPIRNAEMLKIGQADGVVAFHTDLQRSRGTAGMLKLAGKAGLPTWICTEGPIALADFIVDLRRVQMRGK